MKIIRQASPPATNLTLKEIPIGATFKLTPKFFDENEEQSERSLDDVYMKVSMPSTTKYRLESCSFVDLANGLLTIFESKLEVKLLDCQLNVLQ